MELLKKIVIMCPKKIKSPDMEFYFFKSNKRNIIL